MRLFTASLLLALPLLAEAAPFATSTAVNTGSFARAHALPELGVGAVAERGHYDLRLSAANEFYAKGNTLRLDAETLNLTLATRQPLAPGWEWGLSLPLLMQGGGTFDSLIEGWHSTFGLPNAGREEAPRGRYRVQYLRNGRTLLDLSEGRDGLGDMQVQLGWQASPELTLRGLVQLPTGQASSLTGGHAGVALWGEWARLVGERERTRLDLAAGLSLSQTSGPLKSIQKPAAGYVRAGVASRVQGSLQAQLSLQLHSALYDDTGDRPVSGPGGSAAFGFGFLAYGKPVSLMVEEDVLLNSSPDLTLKIAVGF